MNCDLNNKVDIKKRKAILALLVLMIFAFWDASKPSDAGAEMERLNKEELSAVTGAGGVDFSIIGNTARIYFDVHAEVYAEIDSIKMGYYQRENLRTRKYLDLEDPIVAWGADDPNSTFQLWPNLGNYGFLGAPVGYGDDATIILGVLWDKGTPSPTVYDSYVYMEDAGTSVAKPHYVPYTDNDNYQMKWNGTLGAYAEGVQGVNNPGLLGGAAGILGPGTTTFSRTPSSNENHMDWDINIENLRFGTSPDNPMVIDGLVMHLKYDDITSPNKKLTDIIIGTNSMEGNFFGDIIRATGYLNPKLPHKSRYGILNTFGFIDIFNEAPVPVSLKRDSFLYMVDHYRAEYENLTPGKDDNIYYAIPDDPTNNDIHTGFFLRLGLDPTDEQHFGYSLIAGYNELVASAYEPSDIHIQDALNNWWNN